MTRLQKFPRGAFNSPLSFIFSPFISSIHFPAWGIYLGFLGALLSTIFQPSGPASDAVCWLTSSTPDWWPQTEPPVHPKLEEKAAAWQNGGFSRCLQTPWDCDGRWYLRCWLENSCGLGLGTWGLSLGRWCGVDAGHVGGCEHGAHQMGPSWRTTWAEPRLRDSSQSFILLVSELCIFILCVFL